MKGKLFCDLSTKILLKSHASYISAYFSKANGISSQNANEMANLDVDFIRYMAMDIRVIYSSSEHF